MSKIIKEFWLISLKFESALHIGKGSSDAYMGAADIIHNGAGKYVIPGTSIAGVFFSTLKTCVNPDDMKSELWREFTEGLDSKQDPENLKKPENNVSPEASRLSFRSVEIVPDWLQVRDKVRINRKTKTAADGAKFSAWEVIPKDLKIIIEFDNISKSCLPEQGCNLILSWIDTVLSSWKQDGFFLGANSGSGSGFVKVTGIKRCSLNAENLDTYLNSSYQNLPNQEMGWKDYHPTSPSGSRTSVYLKKYSLKVDVDYQNPILIKGGVSIISKVNPGTDAPFIHRNGKPYIPGSSIRGAISSFMDKYGKKDWKILLGQEQEDKGGYIIFSDLMADDDVAINERNLIQIERHAEDQFSRAIYGSGKFDEERLFDTQFTGIVYVLKGSPLADGTIEDLISFMQSGLKHSVVSLGSGACHPKITLEEVS
jgi:CRISPR/Cas system CSM-associated protein Csm3 (group 7 of RAMP superfamily)